MCADDINKVIGVGFHSVVQGSINISFCIIRRQELEGTCARSWKDIAPERERRIGYDDGVQLVVDVESVVEELCGCKRGDKGPGTCLSRE